MKRAGREKNHSHGICVYLDYSGDPLHGAAPSVPRKPKIQNQKISNMTMPALRH